MKDLEEQYNLFNYKTNKKNAALCRKTLQQIKSSCQELRKSILEMSKEQVIPPQPAEPVEIVPESTPAPVDLELEPVVETLVEKSKKVKKVKKERKEGEKSGKRKKKSK